MNTPQEEVKDLVRRLVDEVINGGAMDAIDEFFVPELAGRITCTLDVGRILPTDPG